MTELPRLDSQYDAFLFASVCETDEMTLSVLSVLARHDVDPWQEAARLAQLSRDQAVNSFASRIWKSNSERWSASEASILAASLIELLPSHGRPSSNQLWADDGNARLTFWVVAGPLSMSIAISASGMQKAEDTDASTHIVSTNIQERSGDAIVPRDWNRLGVGDTEGISMSQRIAAGEHQAETGIQFSGLG